MDALNLPHAELRTKLIRLEQQLEVLRAVLKLLLVLVRVMRAPLNRRRLMDETKKRVVLHAIRGASSTIPLRAALKIIGLSSARFFSWSSADRPCELDHTATCPRRHPNGLTAAELAAIREMATSEGFKHVPTSRLAILAQRIGRVFASPSTWAKTVKQRRWRRPRRRVHPERPRVGIRAVRPNDIWHIDTTIFRLLDGSKAYVQGIIDNFSRRILAVTITAQLEPAATAALLLKADKTARAGPASAEGAIDVIIDGGVENLNHAVDRLVEDGTLRRIVAQTDLDFSNSMIERFWQSLKHNWCLLNTIDNIRTLRRLVAFYVREHNSIFPHEAFDGQTPDEMYFGTGYHVPAELARASLSAREARRATNQSTRCESCRR